MGKIIAGVVVVVAVVGFFLWQQGQENDSALMSESVPPRETEGEQKTDQGVVASIKDAMGLGKNMQCTYNVETGGKNMQSTVVVNGDRYQSTTVIGDMTTYALFDGETQYVWTNTAKTGTKMNKACLEEMKNAVKDLSQASAATVPTVEDTEATFDAAKNVSCVPALGVELTVPKDVTFTDQCAMMKQSLEMMKQLRGQMPEGVTIPNTP